MRTYPSYVITRMQVQKLLRTKTWKWQVRDHGDPSASTAAPAVTECTYTPLVCAVYWCVTCWESRLRIWGTSRLLSTSMTYSVAFACRYVFLFRCLACIFNKPSAGEGGKGLGWRKELKIFISGKQSYMSGSLYRWNQNSTSNPEIPRNPYDYASDMV